MFVFERLDNARGLLMRGGSYLALKSVFYSVSWFVVIFDQTLK